MPGLKNNSVSEKRRRSDSEPEVNKYYKSVSNRFMKAKLVSIVLLIAFFAFMLFRFNDDLTYSNLMYLMRDLDTDPKSSAETFKSVSFDEQKNMDFAVYRGELSVIGNRTLKMYNEYGAETRSYQPGYSDPVLVSSDKYLMVYNVGTPSYSIYTSIAKVHSGEATGNIEYAHMNDRGEYLLVCKSKDTKYVVCTYDSSFRPIAEYYKTRYVTSAALGDKGQTIITSFASEDGIYNCQVELYFDNSDKPDNTHTVSGVFPLKCGIWDNGSYYVICTDRVLFFDSKGNLVNTQSSAYEYSSYFGADNCVAVSYDKDSIGGSSDVILYDTEGKEIIKNSLDGSISSVAVKDNTVWLVSSDKISRIFTDSGSSDSLETDDGSGILLPYGNSCVVCMRNGIYGLNFDDYFSSVSTDTITTLNE